MHTIARYMYLGSRRPRGRNYHTSRRTRHELQAHHGHVALLNRPRAAPAMVLMCCVNVNDTPTGWQGLRTEPVASVPGRDATHARARANDVRYDE